MIVTRKMAEEAWRTLRTCARMASEEWDDQPPLPADDRTVTRAFHAASRYAHPDVGGSVENFAAVDRAKHALLEWLKRADRAEPVPAHGEKCPDCRGKGHLMIQRGFRAMRMQCPKCRGTGELGVEHDEGDGR